MCKFTVEYYCIRYHTGNLDTSVTRIATVYAENLDKAIKKIVQADNKFEDIANVSFEEIRESEGK